MTMFKDYLGNEIKVGDLVVWPNRQGSAMWLNHGHVLSVAMCHVTWATKMRPYLQVKRIQLDRYNRPTGNYRNVTLVNLDRVVALGRVDKFLPSKAPTEEMFTETWLDRFMKWIRG